MPGPAAPAVLGGSVCGGSSTSNHGAGVAGWTAGLVVESVAYEGDGEVAEVEIPVGIVAPADAAAPHPEFRASPPFWNTAGGRRRGWCSSMYAEIDHNPVQLV
jgi:hypothetical protein